MQALKDYILLQPVKKTGVLEVSSTGIYKVMSLCSDFEAEVSEGDLVVVDPSTIITLDIEGKEVLFCKDENIMAKLEDDE